MIEQETTQHEHQHQHSAEQTTDTAAPTSVGIAYEVVQFRAKGDAEGFSFTTKTYLKMASLIKDLGEQAVLDLVNSEVQARLGMKARSVSGISALNSVDASKYGQVKANLIQTLTNKFPSKVIFSEDDARNWKPDVRELSITGYTKKINEALKAGDMKAFNLWIEQLKVAAARQQERVLAGL